MDLINLNKEIDLFRIKFEKIIPIIKDQLKTEDVWIVEEIALKTFFNIDCDTSILYDKIRYILKDSDLKIKIEKNKIIDGRYTNLFEFYTSDKINNLRKKREEINENLIKVEKERKEIVKDMVYEDIDKVKNKSIEIINDMSTDIPLPYTVICLRCKKKSILKCPELNCPNCGDKILEKW